jgi:hypothetical protein
MIGSQTRFFCSEGSVFRFFRRLSVLTRRVQTLDALPPHLMTPFNGPIPPSNLLDKIARGVTQAKGEDWPHSLRATRVKLIELARTIAEEDSKPRKATIPEENDMDCSDYPYIAQSEVLQQTTNIGVGKIGLGIGLGPRRPLYRQSSMDFLNTSDTRDDDTINRSVISHLAISPMLTSILLPVCRRVCRRLIALSPIHPITPIPEAKFNADPLPLPGHRTYRP